MSQKRKETQRGMFEAGGRFFVGCNYWASHAGIAMWRKWDADTVRADLKLLSENAVEVLRVFPEYRTWRRWLKENGPALLLQRGT